MADQLEAKENELTDVLETADRIQSKRLRKNLNRYELQLNWSAWFWSSVDRYVLGRESQVVSLIRRQQEVQDMEMDEPEDNNYDNNGKVIMLSSLLSSCRN